MDNSAIGEAMRNALTNQDTMQYLFKTIYSYDSAIGIAIEWNYNIQPKNIYPIFGDENQIAALVTFDTSSWDVSMQYTIYLSLKGGEVHAFILYPGIWNVDFQLFQDVMPWIVAKLGDEKVLVAQVQILGEIQPEGWDESWDFIKSDGSRETLIIHFTSDGNGWNFWCIE